jgi:NAD(P)-dependent dehydrogenase (short-subunit alcohol dehydrogenase family)
MSPCRLEKKPLAGEKRVPKTPDYFAGKTASVTEATSRIGRATPHIFAREDANAARANINEVGAGETAAQVNSKGIESGRNCAQRGR